MYYFDNEYLKQYLDQDVDLYVYANDDWYQIADFSDLADPITGIGYNEYGEGFKFKYKNIGQIRIGDRYFTLDQLQTQRSGIEPEDADTEKKSAPKGEKPDETVPKKDREPELSHFSPVYDIGRDLITEYFKQQREK